jgi:DNA polymerase-3 subunit delta'
MTRFADIQGLERAKAQLRAAVARDRLAHAVLFAGPDGIGKRGLASALAGCFTCEMTPARVSTADTLDACGTCAGCRQFAAGSHPDVRLISPPSGKKDIKIDTVRELRNFIQLAPLTAQRKVAIVLDAHALTINAQNALLKTLEEPPARSLLLLVTHAPGTLLPTVRSRCQRVQCAPLTTDQVIAILRAHDVAEADARLAAAYAEGSPGRALQMLGALGAAGQRLLHDLAEVGSAGYVRTSQMIREITARDDPALPLGLMLTWYRDQAVRAAGTVDVELHNPDPMTPLPPSMTNTVRCADTVIDALARLRRGNPNRQLLFDALFLRLRAT